MLAKVPGRLKERCTLADLDREYSLYEIAIITRAAPARMLGLDRKGHLGPGADGDVTIYNVDSDRQKMFELPRYVIRRGEVVVEDGEVRKHADGTLYHLSPACDPGALPDIQEWFEKHYTVQFRNYPVDEHSLGDHEVIATSSVP
jgi:formylmethanofuran dehydrogenase subunit A